MDIRLALMAGIDIPIPEMQLILHQPSIKEIAMIGEDDFFTALSYICINKEQLISDKSVSDNLSNFQLLMKVLEQSEKKNVLSQLFSLLFPNCTVAYMPKSIILLDQQTKESKLVDDNNFEELQYLIKEILCTKSLFQGDNVQYNPQGQKAKEIRDKIMAGRKKVAEINQKNKESILSRYVSVITIGVSSMSLEDCLKLTLFQLFDLIERYNLYLEWDIDLRVKLAGGTPKQEVENWMKNIH